MNRCFAVLITILFCFPVSSSAQSVWRYLERPDWGASAIVYDYEEMRRYTDIPGSLERDNPAFMHYGLHVGFNIPVVPLNEFASIGINPAFGLSGVHRSSQFSGETTMLALEVPWYATVKIGGDATFKGSSFPLSATFGLGYHYSYLINLGSSDFSEGISAPSAMIELGIGKRKSWGLLKLRYTTDLTSYTIDYSKPDEYLEHTVSVSRTGVHLLYVAAF